MSPDAIAQSEAARNRKRCQSLAILKALIVREAAKREIANAAKRKLNAVVRQRKAAQAAHIKAVQACSNP